MFLVYRMGVPAFFLPYFKIYFRKVCICMGSFSIYFGKAKCVCQREGLVIYAGSAYNVDLFVLCTVFQGFLKRGEYFCTRALGIGAGTLLEVTGTFKRNAPLGSDSKVFRPMMIVFPVVSALKRFRSLGSQNNNLFS